VQGLRKSLDEAAYTAWMTARRHALLALALGLFAGACGEPGPREPGPIVLLVSLDSVRRDFLSCYGYVPPLAPGEKTTPNLDRLAEEGTLFDDAYATSSWTLPSHHTLFSGLPEILHGVELDSQRPVASVPNLTEWTKEKGFRTAGFYSGPYLDPRFGFARGFQRYEACYGRELEQASKRLAEIVERLSATSADSPALGRLYEERAEAERALEIASHRDVSSQQVSDAVIGELERAARDGEPLFLFAHYFDPHYDYVPPEAFAKRFDPGYAGALDGRDFYTSEKVAAFDPSAPSGRRRVVSDRDLEHLRALYAAEIAWTDSQIGRVLDRLDELGLAARTLVVVLGDHGDEFFEHGGIGHRRTLYEEVVRVPLILRWPGHVTPNERIAGPVQMADVFPILEGVVCDSGLILVPAPACSLPLFVGGESDDSSSPWRMPTRSLLPTLPASASEILLARVVRFEPVEVHLGPDASATVAGQKVIVIETYRKGSLKITRSKTWARPGEALDEGARTRFDERTAELRAEKLSWIDLARHPEEHDADSSRDFSDPEARAALQEFHDAYRELSKQRTESRDSATPAELATQLRALGYIGAEVWQIGADELVLPPPGAEVLGSR